MDGKIKKATDLTLENIALIVFFFGGILGIYKSAYDYTIIKAIFGYFFVFLLSFYFLFIKHEFKVNFSVLIVSILFFAYILIKCFSAPFKYGSASLLENYLLYFMIFFLSSNLKVRNGIVNYWLIAAFIASLIGFFQYLGPRHYVVYPFGNPNFFAGHIVMPLCIGFSVLFDRYYRDEQKFMVLFFLLIGFLTLLFTKSRAAIFGFFFGISTIFFLLNKKKKRKWAGYIILAIFLLSTSKLIYREFVENIRYYIWSGTWSLIKQKLFTGLGFGQFIFHYLYFRKREYFLQPEATPVTNHAHNEYLEMLAEMGIIGFLIFISFIFLILRKYFSKNYRIEREVIAGFVGGIIAVLIDNIFSTNLRNSSTTMYFYFLLGILCSTQHDTEYPYKLSKFFYMICFLVSFVMSVFFFYYRVIPEVYLKKAIWAKDMKRYREAIENYTKVCVLNPYNYVAWYKLAYVYGNIGDYDMAEKIYLYINNYLFPHFAKTDTNLGTVYLKKGNYKKALHYYLYAEWLNPYDIDVLCSIASIYLIFYNDIEKAVNYLERVLTLDPQNRYANRVLNQLRQEGKLKGRKNE